MAQFTIYKSTDASAPVLTGENSKMVDLLTAVLVNGYGAKAAAGWTREFTATNKAVYRPGAGSRLYYRVNDAGSHASALAREAQVRGFETMSDIDTGTGPFPTAAQSSLTQNSLILRKSTAASSTARPWTIYADNRTAYIFVQTGDIASTYFGGMIGDIYSYAPTDAYQGMIIARFVENSSPATSEAFGGVSTVLGTAHLGHFIARGYTQSGGSVATGKMGDYGKQGGSAGFRGDVPFTNGPDGGIYLCPLQVHETGGNIRGRLRGCFCWLHTVAGIADGDTFSGSGDFATKAYEAVSLVTGAAGTAGVAIMETSNTVDTN